MDSRDKFQIEILKAILEKRHGYKYVDISETEVAVVDGYVAFVFPRKILMVRYEELPTLPYDFSGANEDLPQLVDTNIRKLGNGYQYVKLWNKEKEIVSVVRGSYFSKFAGFDFFSAGGVNPVFVKDGLKNLVGMIMPVRSEAF